MLWLYISHCNPNNTKEGMYNLIPDKGFTLQEKYPINAFSPDGTQGFNNVYRLTKYQEPIDENKLNEISYDYCYNKSNDWLTDSDNNWKDVQDAYKVGYRKAMET